MHAWSWFPCQKATTVSGFGQGNDKWRRRSRFPWDIALRVIRQQNDSVLNFRLDNYDERFYSDDEVNGYHLYVNCVVIWLPGWQNLFHVVEFMYLPTRRRVLIDYFGANNRTFNYTIEFSDDTTSATFLLESEVAEAANATVKIQ